MVIDAILAIVAIWGFYMGFSRGIIKTVFTIISLLFGFMAAVRFGPAATRFLEDIFNSNEPLMFIAGFLLAFFLTMIIIRLIASGLEELLKTANINVINQVAGGILFGALNILIFSVLVWFGRRSHIVTDETISKSFSYTYLEKFPGKMRGLYDTLKPSFMEFWDESVKFMDRMEEKMEMERTESEPVIRDISDDSESTN
jgi:membrane protein required for colicin V production